MVSMSLADDTDVDPLNVGDLTYGRGFPTVSVSNWVLPPPLGPSELGVPKLPAPKTPHPSQTDRDVAQDFVALTRSYADVIGVRRPQLPGLRSNSWAFAPVCAGTLRFLAKHSVSPARWLAWQPRTSFPKLISLERAQQFYALCRIGVRLPVGELQFNDATRRVLGLHQFIHGEARLGRLTDASLTALLREYRDAINAAQQENRLVEAELWRARDRNQWVWGPQQVLPEDR